MEHNFTRTFSRRSVALFMFILLIMLTCILRIFVLCNDTVSAGTTEINTVSLSFGELRGNIFDTNLVSLTGCGKKVLAAVSPEPQAIMAISEILEGEELKNAMERLSSGKPILLELEVPVDCEGITCITAIQHESKDNPAEHVLGYTGADGHGVCGIEAACDSLLYTGEKLRYIYSVDGHGQVLPGVRPKLAGDTSVYRNGVALTLDGRIQSITEKAMSGINRGAAVVLEVGTGKIRAMVSRPAYDTTDVASSLTDGSSPLINRALCAYNVGSVFKPCIAAAALEQGRYAGMHYTCTGSCPVGGHTFNCNSIHGRVGMREALTYSCNTFFYNLAVKTGASAVYDMARSLNFGNPVALASGITTQSGKLTALSRLSSSDAAMANFAIGQGDLLLSPLSIGYMYLSIAGDGTYRISPLVESEIRDKRRVKTESVPNATRVMSAKTAAILRDYLISTVSEGTGKKAMPQTGGAGGKTATAQTGWVNADGGDVTQGWFCGFFPADNPEYVVVVLAEDVASGGSVCAPVFAAVADGINALNLS